MEEDVVVRKPDERAMTDFRCPRAEHPPAVHVVLIRYFHSRHRTVELRSTAAVQEAAPLTRAGSGDAVAPLQGVPMTVNESLKVAVLHTTSGNPSFRTYVADADATVVQRLGAQP
jgi:Asp-tRNA(Asn)/Glu-tRNA(Gln) amidotransferase A subunit family amidase